MAVSAGSVLMLTVGGVLTYAGFIGKNPLEALREIASGHPTAIRSTASADSQALTVSGAVPSSAVVAAGGGLPQLPAAVAKYSGDRYSKLRRSQPGYSDCSSFVGKGLRDLGIKPPGISNTTAYLASSEWMRIPDGSQGAGDVAINLVHMVVVINATTAIGQENPTRNVQTGSIKDLMTGTGSYIFLRYHVPTALGASGGKAN